MVVLAAACMVLLAKQATVLGVALLWLLFSAFQNGECATLSAAIAMGTLYLLYFLRDAVHYARLFPGQTAADGLRSLSAEAIEFSVSDAAEKRMPFG